MANAPALIETESAEAYVAEGHGETVAHADPVALGLEPYQWVSVAMIFLILIFIWKKVPALITGGLDNKIAAIRTQLDEAKQLRAEAEALRNEYSAKIANAEKDAEAMLANARHEADALVAKAEVDSTAMVERRKKMAEDKIGAAEREAVDEVRATAVNAAARASRKLIAEKHGAADDSLLVDQAIAGL
ncbi:F0F1 ATP synthase subunit B family protein [Altererythrobacter sp. CAU 1778]